MARTLFLLDHVPAFLQELIGEVLKCEHGGWQLRDAWLHPMDAVSVPSCDPVLLILAVLPRDVDAIEPSLGEAVHLKVRKNYSAPIPISLRV
jgi:hypothetical protein